MRILRLFVYLVNGLLIFQKILQKPIDMPLNERTIITSAAITKQENKMRAPVKTEKSLRQDAAFEALKKEVGVSTILDEGFKVMHAKFNVIYKDGMTPDQLVDAYKGLK